MALAGLSFTIVNGQLGQVEVIEDRVAGMTLTGVATDDLALGAAVRLTSLKELEALGITSEYDVANDVYAWGHVRDFYGLAPIGTVLWVMLTSDATTMAQAADKLNAYAAALRDAAEGEITLMGITRTPPSAYAPTITAGIDPDAIAAIAKLQELGEESAALNMPFRGIVEGRAFNGNYTQLQNLRQGTSNRVAVAIFNEYGGSYASVGLLLGWICRLQVHRNIGRVKSGAVPVAGVYISSGAEYKTLTLGNKTVLDDKGYLFLRKHPNRTGFYFNEDWTAASATDDYNHLALGFLIDKAQRVIYTEYITNLMDNIEVDPDTGKLEEAAVKALEDELTATLKVNLLGSQPQASAVKVDINSSQNIIGTGKLVARFRITPMGTLRALEGELGLDNPYKTE